MNHSIVYPVIRAETNVSSARCESPSGLVFLGVSLPFYFPVAPSQLTTLYVHCYFFSLGSLGVLYCWPCTHAPSALLQRSLHPSAVRDFIQLFQLSDHGGLSTLAFLCAVSAVWDACPSLVLWLTLSFWKTLLLDTPTSKDQKRRAASVFQRNTVLLPRSVSHRDRPPIHRLLPRLMDDGGGGVETA